MGAIECDIGYELQIVFWVGRTAIVPITTASVYECMIQNEHRAHTSFGRNKICSKPHSHAALGSKLNFIESNDSGRCNKSALFSGILNIKYNIYFHQEFVDYSSLFTMQTQVPNHKLPFESDN